MDKKQIAQVVKATLQDKTEYASSSKVKMLFKRNLKKYAKVFKYLEDK